MVILLFQGHPRALQVQVNVSYVHFTKLVEVEQQHYLLQVVVAVADQLLSLFLV